MLGQARLGQKFQYLREYNAESPRTSILKEDEILCQSGYIIYLCCEHSVSVCTLFLCSLCFWVHSVSMYTRFLCTLWFCVHSVSVYTLFLSTLCFCVPSATFNLWELYLNHGRNPRCTVIFAGGQKLGLSPMQQDAKNLDGSYPLSQYKNQIGSWLGLCKYVVLILAMGKL